MSYLYTFFFTLRQYHSQFVYSVFVSKSSVSAFLIKYIFASTLVLNLREFMCFFLNILIVFKCTSIFSRSQYMHGHQGTSPSLSLSSAPPPLTRSLQNKSIIVLISSICVPIHSIQYMRASINYCRMILLTFVRSMVWLLLVRLWLVRAGDWNFMQIIFQLCVVSVNETYIWYRHVIGEAYFTK